MCDSVQDAKIEPEEFTSRLQTELKSSPQPYLIPFLKVSALSSFFLRRAGAERGQLQACTCVAVLSEELPFYRGLTEHSTFTDGKKNNKKQPYLHLQFLNVIDEVFFFLCTDSIPLMIFFPCIAGPQAACTVVHYYIVIRLKSVFLEKI